MSDFRISQSACDPVASADQSREVLRSGLGGEAVATRGHGRYYEAASRGRVFVASGPTATSSRYIEVGGTSSSSFALINPPDSNRVIVPIVWDLVVISVGGYTGTLNYVFGLFWNSASRSSRAGPPGATPQQMPIADTFFTVETSIPALVGSNYKSEANVWTNVKWTLGQGSTLIKVFCNPLQAIGAGSPPPAPAQTPYIARFSIEFCNDVILPPATWLCIGGVSSGSGGLLSTNGMNTIVWEEVDL